MKNRSKATKQVLYLCLIILLNFHCKQIKSKDYKSQSDKVANEAGKNKSLHEYETPSIIGDWLLYYSEMITQRGRKDLKRFHSDLQTYSFNDSVLIRAISGSRDSMKILYNGSYQIVLDSSLIIGKRQNTIHKFTTSHLEIEEPKHRILTHKAYKLKKIKKYNQANNKTKVLNILKNNSIQIIDKYNEECLQSSRYEFCKFGKTDFVFKLNNCAPRQLSWLHGYWSLNTQNIPSELFITFSTIDDTPIQIKEVKENNIIGIRFGNEPEDKEVIIEPVSKKYDVKDLLGTWSNFNKNSSDILNLRITKNNVEILFQTGKEVFDYKLAKSNELLYLTSLNKEKTKDKHILRFFDLNSNKAEASLKIFSSKDYKWKFLTLKK